MKNLKKDVKQLAMGGKSLAVADDFKMESNKSLLFEASFTLHINSVRYNSRCGRFLSVSYFTPHIRSIFGITIASKKIIENAQTIGYPLKQDHLKTLEAPGGYKYFILEESTNNKDPVLKVTLACSNLQNSIDYWHGILGMKIYGQTENSITLGYSDEQCKLELQCIDCPIDHAETSGRIAFACPTDQLAGIEENVKKTGHKILTPLISLDTPGKATVHVVILADPDGHEICFVGDESFRKLSQVDPNGDILLQEAIASDQSDEWFAKKSSTKII